MKPWHVAYPSGPSSRPWNGDGTHRNDPGVVHAGFPASASRPTFWISGYSFLSIWLLRLLLRMFLRAHDCCVFRVVCPVLSRHRRPLNNLCGNLSGGGRPLIQRLRTKVWHMERFDWTKRRWRGMAERWQRVLLSWQVWENRGWPQLQGVYTPVFEVTGSWWRKGPELFGGLQEEVDHGDIEHFTDNIDNTWSLVRERTLSLPADTHMVIWSESRKKH